jgi:hypothetical protein
VIEEEMIIRFILLALVCLIGWNAYDIGKLKDKIKELEK